MINKHILFFPVLVLSLFSFGFGCTTPKRNPPVAPQPTPTPTATTAASQPGLSPSPETSTAPTTAGTLTSSTPQSSQPSAGSYVPPISSSPAGGASSLPTRPTSPTSEIFKLTSNAFINNGSIPKKYTCEGGDVRPNLRFAGAPQKTQTFAIIMDDPQPDAPSGAWLHWTVWNIPASQTDLAEGVKVGVEGATESGTPGYLGPCPPPGPAHVYKFKAYALDNTLTLKTGASLSQLNSAINGHILAQTELKGSYASKDSTTATASPSTSPSSSTAAPLPARPPTTTSADTTVPPASGGIPAGASTRCRDSESTDSPTILGNVTIEYAEYGSSVYQLYGSWDDVCVDSNNVKEYACSGSRDYTSKSVACPSGTTCSAGKCSTTATTPAPVSTTPAPTGTSSACTDSDGGKNYNTRGEVVTKLGGDYSRIDYCPETAPMVSEYFCNADGTAGREDYSCPGTCSDGACVSGAATGSGSTPGCSGNSDCGYKQICQSGSCVSVDCTNDSQCSGCKRCSDNSCRSCGYGSYGCTC